MKETRIHDKDTGSADAQISILTARIEELASHLKKNPKDYHSRRGLLGLVANRQAHLKYLEKKHPKRHAAVARKLGLKK